MKKVILIVVMLIVLVGCSAPDSMEQLAQDIADAGGPSSMIAIPPAEPTPIPTLVIEPPQFFDCSQCVGDGYWLSFHISVGDLVGDLGVLIVDGEYQTSFYEWGHIGMEDFYNVQHPQALPVFTFLEDDTVCIDGTCYPPVECPFEQPESHTVICN